MKPSCASNITKVAKSVDKNSQTYGGLQPSACFLRVITIISRPSKYQYMSDTPHKPAPVKADLFTFHCVTLACNLLAYV